MTATIIAVANHKGGVGKTSFAAHLSFRAAELGYRTIAVDLDAQANLSRCFVDIDSVLDASSAADLFLSKTAPAPISTSEPNLSLIPANPGLSDVDGTDLQRLFNARTLLQAYDAEVIIIDTPPQLSTRTISAICSAQLVVCPFQPEKFSLEGLTDILTQIATMRTNINPGLREATLVPNMVANNTPYHHEILTEARKAFGDSINPNQVSRSIEIPKAQEHRRPVWRNDRSRSATEFRAVSDSLLRLAGLHVDDQVTALAEVV